MAVTCEEISMWFKNGQKRGATHMIVVCDEFDWTDYPVYVLPGESAREKSAELDGKRMQKVMEVYSLSMDMEAQLNEHRAFHYD